MQTKKSLQKLQTLNSHLTMKSLFSTKNQGYPYKLEKGKDGAIILNPLQQHKYSLIWMHGLGDSPASFVDLFMNRQYQLTPDHCKVILLQAPNRPVTMNGGYVMPSWYDINIVKKQDMMSMETLYNKYSQEEQEESYQTVRSILEEERTQNNIQPQNLYVGGFSQGCAMSIATFLKYEFGVGGIIGLSGMNALKFDISKIPAYEEKKKTNIWLYHGIDDNMIRIDIAKMSYEALRSKEHGFNVTFQEEEGLDHSLSQKELMLLKQHLHKQMV
eukprot:403336766